MGFWNEILRLYDQPSQLAGKGIFKVAKGITGSDKVASMGARMGSVSTRALGGDPIPFRENQEGADFGMTDTSWRKGRQAGDWLGSIIGSLFIGGALGGGGAAAGEGGGGGGATVTGGSNATGLELEAAAGTGQGAWTEPAAGGFNWQQLVQKMAGKGMAGGGQQGGGGVSLGYLIAQQQAEEAARQAQEMLGGDSDLINYMAKMQMQNNLRRAG